MAKKSRNQGYCPRKWGLIFSYIHRLGPFLGVQDFEFQYFGGFQKNEYFLRYDDFVDILGVIPKFDYI